MRRPLQGVPLAAVFLLIAVIAILLGLLKSGNERAGLVELNHVEALAPFCFFVGLIYGIGRGLNQPRRLGSAFLGAFFGGLFGAVAGTLLAQPPHPALVAGGCGVLLAIGGIVRRFSRVVPSND